MNAHELTWPFFDEEHRAFAARLQSWLQEVDVLDDERRADASSRSWVRTLAKDGFLRACVPDFYGGLRSGLDVRTLCLAREALAHHSSMADFAFAMQGLGSGAITLFGSAEQQRRYLPNVANGRCVPAFALSEREAGSDVAAIATKAVRDGDVYVLDGEKTWISNAGIADLYVVFARSGEAGSKGLSAFAVDTVTPGFSVGKRIETISPHPLGTLRFDRARIPVTQRIGDEGEGFKIALATVDVFRSTVGAAAVGMARRALAETLTHVKSRKLFGSSLADQQLTQAALAEMATEIDAAALLVYRAAWTKDVGAERVTREAAMAKWYATEAAGRVCDRAVQLFGGRGVTHGEIVERLYRDVRALRIYE
ncbi:MAG: acyl-CoA dehydrogenase family protein, partial [Candidatus Eremiobacteraeota bacterium]|nr:acyl-CoA dehydrogenase family protein [Candidatus Eremiobacteraeota bacterium]